jgi:hypothetical protein
MKIKIESDFHDYYDHAFASKYDTPDYILKRPSVYPQLPREKMFQLFTEYGMSTPQYGRDKSLFTCEYVVEHLDETAHRGEGKHHVKLEDAGEDTFKVEALESIDPIGIRHPLAVSIRKLFIGKHRFELQYDTAHDWRSNGNGCTITYLNMDENARRFNDLANRELKEFPILALDFIPTARIGSCGKYLDINISPSWKGTFLEKLLHPSVVHEFIEEYVRENHRQD